ncbi:MAG: retroviral-like aspartic protease family protein [Gemmataceae bacterium]
MGKVLVRAKIENMEDVFAVHRGLIKPEEVRSIRVTDALVDTGASILLMPKRLISPLGLRYLRTRPAQALGGSVQVPIYSVVRLTIEGRNCSLEVGEIDDRFTVLIGQIALGMMDWVVDPKGQRLIGNPAHGGEEMIDVF